MYSPQHSAIEDALTTLHTRPVLEAVLPKECCRAERFEHWLSMMLIDVDNLAEINQVHGYGVGDRILERMGILLRAYFRQHDWVARYGEDTIAVLLPETDPRRCDDPGRAHPDDGRGASDVPRLPHRAARRRDGDAWRWRARARSRASRSITSNFRRKPSRRCSRAKAAGRQPRRAGRVTAAADFDRAGDAPAQHRHSKASRSWSLTVRSIPSTPAGTCASSERPSRRWPASNLLLALGTDPSASRPPPDRRASWCRRAPSLRRYPAVSGA